MYLTVIVPKICTFCRGYCRLLGSYLFRPSSTQTQMRAPLFSNLLSKNNSAGWSQSRRLTLFLHCLKNV